METQNLELVKSLSYAFYGVCAVLAALIGFMFKLYFGMRKTQKEEITAVKEEEKEKSAQALKCQKCHDKVSELEKRHKETDAWIDEIVKKMEDGFKEINKTIKEALQ